MTRLVSMFLVLLLAGLVILAVFVVSEERLSWRAEVIVLKAQGRLDDLSWKEILAWLRPGSPVYLGNLARLPNPYGALYNPGYNTLADIEAGKQTYRRLCSGCHGVGGEGVSGPSLDSLIVGNEWDLYRTIDRGIEGTAMRSHGLSEIEIWRVSAYVATLADGAAARDPLHSKLRDIESVRFSRIREPSPANWLTYSGNLKGWRYSSLNQISADTVQHLQLLWAYQMDVAPDKIETSPVIVDGVMFITESAGNVTALDALDGTELWHFSRSIPDNIRSCCGLVNRGVAVLNEQVFVATMDAHLIALDLRDGTLKWEVELADYRQGYSITSAPLAVNGGVAIGVAGGDFGIRGFVDVYETETGNRRWRFYTVPEPNEQGGETWGGGEAWRTGGVSAWMTGSFDPELGLLYWGTGNPGPIYNGDSRPGDNLYGASVLALDAQTGSLAWHFQFTPHGLHDWDSTQIPMLVDATVDSELRNLMLFANRNGFYYVLDRVDGKFLSATPFAKQTWTSGMDDEGRPTPLKTAKPSESGTVVWPSQTGATSWWSPSYNPVRKRVYVPVAEMPAQYFKADSDYEAGELFLGGVAEQSRTLHQNLVRSLDAMTGELLWEAEFPRSKRWSQPGGILSTAGNLLFIGNGKVFYAMHVDDGRTLWEINTGGPIEAAPVTYAVGGKQVVAVSTGRTLMTFALPELIVRSKQP